MFSVINPWPVAVPEGDVAPADHFVLFRNNWIQQTMIYYRQYYPDTGCGMYFPVSFH
jgi:hypothetical protein